VSRSTARRDPSLWHCVVLRWLDRKSNRAGLKPAPPVPPSSRLLLTLRTKAGEVNFLDDCIERANRGSVENAREVVGLFRYSVRMNRGVDPRIEIFLEQARQRYSKDPKRNIAKALLLVRTVRGNPGGVSQKRRMTSEAHIEAGQMVLELLDDGMSEKFAVLTVKGIFEASERTIRKDAVEQRAIRAEEEKAEKVLKKLERGGKFPE